MPIQLLFTATLLAIPGSSGPGLHFVDVGQGSALILRGSAGDAVIVDSGPAGAAEALLWALGDHEIDRVALWIHSHHDADHLGGLSRVVAGLDGQLGSADDLVVEQFWDRGLDEPVPQTEAFATYLELAGDARARPAPGSIYAAPGLRVEVLDPSPPAGAEASLENHRGLALCVEVGSLRALLPGDLPSAAVEDAARACGPVDLLWASHHGAVDGSSARVLELADPGLVVLGAGHDNGYCHPARASLSLFAERRLWIQDGAGLGPAGSCPAIADLLGPGQRVIGGDLWIEGQGSAWLGMPGGGFSPAPN